MRTHDWVWLPLAAIAAPAIPMPAYAATYLTIQQAQHAIFPGASFTSVGQADVWRTARGEYFVVDKVVGKHEYITYAVGITAAGTVKQIEIMEYNESYGYQVRDASWRAQFVGKSAASPLQLNVDIKNISGATLSSKHITDGVKRVLQKLAAKKG
jgi:Na+-translocating ferredoxin:NAD+ oxidoreductase RnfG subunit